MAKTAKRTRRDLTIDESRRALLYVEGLAKTLGCAGAPACEAETGGEACSSCAAIEWLDTLERRGRRWEAPRG